jgi:DNA-binding phage protein
LHEPLPHLATRVNELARAKELPEPFPMRDRRAYKGRGKLGALIRAYGGVTQFAKASGSSETRIRAWTRERNPNPLLEVRERVNALARAARVAEPFSRTPTVRFRGRGPLAELVRACGGVAGLAREASVGETSVYRWIRGTPPWRSVARDVNQLARARGLPQPFDIAKCPVKTDEDAAVR